MACLMRLDIVHWVASDPPFPERGPYLGRHIRVCPFYSPGARPMPDMCSGGIFCV